MASRALALRQPGARFAYPRTGGIGLAPSPDVVDVVAELNAALRAVAREHGAVIADIHGRFLGHGLQAGNSAQPNARPHNRTLWYCQIIEPNAWGADAVRAAFWAGLHEHGAARS